MFRLCNSNHQRKCLAKKRCWTKLYRQCCSVLNAAWQWLDYQLLNQLAFKLWFQSTYPSWRAVWGKFQFGSWRCRTKVLFRQGQFKESLSCKFEVLSKKVFWQCCFAVSVVLDVDKKSPLLSVQALILSKKSFRQVRSAESSDLVVLRCWTKSFDSVAFVGLNVAWRDSNSLLLSFQNLILIGV